MVLGQEGSSNGGQHREAKALRWALDTCPQGLGNPGHRLTARCLPILPGHLTHTCVYLDQDNLLAF